jgi:hypothetical protein
MRFPLKLFNWDKSTKTLTVEISTLNLEGRLPNSLTIFNPETQQERIFNYATSKLDDGDICYWRYRCPEHFLDLIIFND